MKVCSEEMYMGMDTRLATEGPGGALDSASRNPKEQNAVDMPGYVSAVKVS